MIKLNYPDFWHNNNIISYLLSPLSLFYYFFSFLRKKIQKPINLGAPVICIGNINVGGAGKTPLVIHLALHYMSLEKRVCIVSKGYLGSYKKPVVINFGMIPSFTGDEALEIFNKLSKTGISGEEFSVIIASRPSKALNLIKKFKPDVIITDDGLQNNGFYKDVKIVVIDLMRKFGNGMLFPAGPLRQLPGKVIKNTSLVVINANGEDINKDENKKFIGKVNSLQPNFFMAKTEMESEISANVNYLAVCAISNPGKFKNLLNDQKFLVKGFVDFADHHNYTLTDVNNILLKAKELEVEKIITTSKDYVKLSQFKVLKKHLIECPISLKIEDFDKLLDLINEKIDT